MKKSYVYNRNKNLYDLSTAKIFHTKEDKANCIKHETDLLHTRFSGTFCKYCGTQMTNTWGTEKKNNKK